MNKDAVLASIIGFAIGLFITGGILLGPTLISQLAANRMKQSGEVASAVNEQKQQTVLKEEQKRSLTVESPAHEGIVSDEKIDVLGKATPDHIIIIAGDIDETVVTASADGSFKGTITVKEGKNDLSISDLGMDSSTIQKIVVFYTP